jgi:hypothetical protein
VGILVRGISHISAWQSELLEFIENYCFERKGTNRSRQGRPVMNNSDKETPLICTSSWERIAEISNRGSSLQFNWCLNFCLCRNLSIVIKFILLDCLSKTFLGHSEYIL